MADEFDAELEALRVRDAMLDSFRFGAGADEEKRKAADEAHQNIVARRRVIALIREQRGA